jgi:ubiquinone/menaquinone biosynthesis C-methylase UbiE
MEFGLRSQEIESRLNAERVRIRKEYLRREREIPMDLYAPWQASETLMREERKQIAAMLLHRAGCFPEPADHCLEIGYGTQGWLIDLLSWGVPPDQLHGIDLNPERAARARRLLPGADLRIGDAGRMPWPDASFRVVVASTVFSSVLDPIVRLRMADEITRVLIPGGALVWYDLAVPSPRNHNVRQVRRKELRKLFPSLSGAIRSLTLAPPLARLVAPKSHALATLLQTIPFLRTHLLAVLVKKEGMIQECSLNVLSVARP